jgi:hypothetical protein
MQRRQQFWIRYETGDFQAPSISDFVPHYISVLSTTYKFIVLRYIATIVKGYKNIFTHVFYDCDGI